MGPAGWPRCEAPLDLSLQGIELSEPPRGYPRPKSATPIYAPLVVAYDACSPPGNGMHAPPLPGDSCSPAAESSPWLTVGNPPANFTGFVRLRAILGAAGPPDDSDLEITATLEDVRCKAGATPCGPANTNGGADYTGQLQGQFPYRRTDREQGPAGGPYTQAGTMIDGSVSFPLSCSSTTTTIGATCSASTSLTAIVGAEAVRDAQRTILEVQQVTVNDGGVDGQAATTPNSVFARQGVFAP